MKSFEKFLVACLLAGVVASSAGAGISETWNTSGSTNGWYYFDENRDKTIFRETTGGVGGSRDGYAYCLLNGLDQWLSTGGIDDYYPLYSFSADHALDLTTEPIISLYIKSVGALDLYGGTLAFWIGEWNDDTETRAFYRQDIPINIAQSWKQVELNVYEGTWLTTVLGSGEQPTPQDLYTNPQQWGIGIFGSTATPTGMLCFDSFVNTTPEPSVLTLIGLGGLSFLRRRHRADSGHSHANRV